MRLPMRERYWVESAPGYVRLRHELGLRGRMTRAAWFLGGEDWLQRVEKGEAEPEWLSIRAEDIARPDGERDENDEWGLQAYLDGFEDEEAEYQWLVEQAYLDSLDEGERERYLNRWTADDARQAAAERAGRGAGGMSARGRAEMWRRVLSLPFEMLGDRPLWITLTYPREWRRWVPDGRALEAHRRAFGERWRRGFGPPLGMWSKEFQLAEGRPHLHLLMRAPEVMSEEDYRGFQERTRLAKANERQHGRYQGRAPTDIIGMRYGGQTAMELRRWWSEIVTGNTNATHHARGVEVRTVFYSYDDNVALNKRRVAIAAYMAGEAAKFGQKVPPDDFGAVGNYFGQWGRAGGFRPEVTAMEVERSVWEEMNRRLTFLLGWRREAKRTRGGTVGDAWKRRRSWQGLTVGGLGPEELARLLAWSVAAAERKKADQPLRSPAWDHS